VLGVEFSLSHTLSSLSLLETCACERRCVQRRYPAFAILGLFCYSRALLKLTDSVRGVEYGEDPMDPGLNR
jgi:hypothetical protein